MYRPPKEYYVHIISYIVSILHKLYLNSSIGVDEITDCGRLFHIIYIMYIILTSQYVLLCIICLVDPVHHPVKVSNN